MTHKMASCKFCHKVIYIAELGINPDVQCVVRKRTGSKKEWFHKSCLYSIWGNKKEY